MGRAFLMANSPADTATIILPLLLSCSGCSTLIAGISFTLFGMLGAQN